MGFIGFTIIAGIIVIIVYLALHWNDDNQNNNKPSNWDSMTQQEKLNYLNSKNAELDKKLDKILNKKK